MLTFDTLVQETAQQLVDDAHKIDGDLVRKVLQDAGIDECLRQNMLTPQGRLIVHKIQISGEKRLTEDGSSQHFEYQRTLGNGLSAWVGANGSGKSTILACILWALTGSESGIPKRLRSWIHDVIVQFSVGDTHYTSRVTRTADGNVSGGIYAGFMTSDQIDLDVDPLTPFTNRDQMRDEIDLFFMQQLGISTLRWTAHSSEKDDPDLHAHSTTWRTYAHAIHIEDDSYDDLIIDPQKGYGRQDRKILEMMLGVDHARAVAEIQVQADFAKEAYGRARARVSGKRDSVTDHIKLLQQECLDIQQAIDMMQQEQTPVEDDSTFVAKREQRAALLTEQNRFTQEISGLEAHRVEIEQEILDAEREKVAIQEQSEVAYLINSLAVVRCPHCESAVDDQTRLTLEHQQHTCHVCMQPIQRTRSRGDLKTILRERDQLIGTQRSALKRIDQDIADRRQKLSASREASARLGKELESTVTTARQGFTTSYTNLLLRKGQIEGQLEQLRQSFAEIDAEHTEVETAATWHLILQTAAHIADESVFGMYETVFAELTQLVVKLATQFGLPDLERVVIDEKRYVKIYQGGVQLSHNDLARSERVKFKVAFHLALMLLQIRAGLGKHPAFLIIDTPGTAEVNDADFIAMTRDLTRFHQDFGSQVQILLATARPEAGDYLPPDTLAKPINGTFF